MTSVTRLEIAECIEHAFDGSALNREALVRSAVASGARREVVGLLEGLDELHYWHLRDLWPQLPNLPIER